MTRKKPKLEVLPVHRICQRCATWEKEFCMNEDSPHALKQCGAGWNCDEWKPNEETRNGLRN